MALSKRTPVTQDIDGEKCFIKFNPTLYRAIPQFEPQPGDIIQVSFPRSGSHWVQQIIQLILQRGKSAKTFSEFSERAPFLERHFLQENAATPRLLRTHSPMGRIRVSPKAKYVYVARNPWDCCVSCFHLIRECLDCGFQDGTFDEFLDAFLNAQLGLTDYFDHVLSGYRRRDEPNVFFVTYEDLQKDKPGVVMRLAYFLGQDYGTMLENDRGLFQTVMEKSTAKYMKGFIRPRNSEVLEVSKCNSNPTKPQEDEGKPALVNIVRSGMVGERKRYFSRDNIKKTKRKIDEKTAGSDLMTLWKSEEPF